MNAKLLPTESSSLSELVKPRLVSIPTKELQQALQDLTSAYDKAQVWAKKYETTFKQYPIAAVNQMRNAGYHICCFINTSEIIDQLSPLINFDELRSAYKHLLRAYYDVLDDFTNKISDIISQIENDYKILNITPASFFPDFYKWKSTLTKLESFNISDNEEIGEFAATKNKREAHYERIVQHINELIEINTQLQHMTDRLVIEAQRIDKEEQRFEKTEKRAITAEDRATKAEQRAITAESRDIKRTKLAYGALVISIGALVISICLFLFGNKVLISSESKSTTTVSPPLHQTQ